MIALSPKAVAAALGGNVSAGQVRCPGPGHSRRDRSLTIKLDPAATDGFLVYSHAGDDFADCRDFVRERLGLPREVRERETTIAQRNRTSAPKVDDDDRSAPALALWSESVDPRGTRAEGYLANRGLTLGADIAGEVLRWNALVGAMVALFRNVETGAPQAVSRTFINLDGSKRERKFLGPVGGAAVMLDRSDSVTGGLHIGEGVETGIAARHLGLSPTWALGSCGAIAAFPVLPGIECLTLLAENDAASAKAVRACGERWHAAGRIVLINRSAYGKDLNDALRGAA